MGKKQLRTVYLYADGHAVEVYESTTAAGATVSTVQIHEKWGPAAHFDNGVGRLRMNAGAAWMLRRATGLRCGPASVESGSDRTREKGIALQTISAYTPAGTMFINSFPGLISADAEYHADADEKFADVKDQRYWADIPVDRVHRAPTALDRRTA